MVRVPVYENLTQPLNNFNAYSSTSGNAEAFGAGIGAAAQKVGESLKDAATRLETMKQEDDETYASDFYVKSAVPAYRELSEQFKTTQGRNTLDAYGDYQKKATELQDKLLSQVNDSNQRKILSRMIAQKYNETMGGFADYHQTQRLVAQKNASEGLMGVFHQTVKDNPFSDQKFKGALESAYAEQERMGEQLGLDSASIELRRNNVKNEFYDSRLSIMMNTNPFAAKEFLDKTPEVPEELRQAYTEKLRPRIMAGNAVRILQNMEEQLSGQMPSLKINVNGKGLGKGYEGKLKKQYDNVPAQYDSLYKKYAQLNGIPYALVRTISFQESKYDPMAVSKSGARGLMQLMPLTAQEMGLSEKDIHDPEKNIAAGTAYFAKKLKEFKGNIILALAAYNAGAGNVRKALRKAGENAPLSEVLKHLPMPEQTVPYVENISGTYEKTTASSRKDSPSTDEDIVNAALEEEIPSAKGQGSWVESIAGSYEVSPPTPSAFPANPANATHSIAKVYETKQILQEQLMQDLSAGVIDDQMWGFMNKLLDAKASDQEKLITQRAIDAENEVLVYLRNNPHLNRTTAKNDPYISERIPLMKDTGLSNMDKTLDQNNEVATQLELASDDARIQKTAKLLDPSGGFENLDPYEKIQFFAKAEKIRQAADKRNFEDLSKELDQIKIAGGRDNVLQDISSRPSVKDLPKPLLDELMVKAASVELARSTDRFSSFKKMARLTGDPELLAKTEGFSLLTGDQQNEILDSARASKSISQEDLLNRLRKDIADKKLKGKAVEDHEIFKQLSPLRQNEALNFSEGKQDDTDKKAWELVYKLLNKTATAENRNDFLHITRRNKFRAAAGNTFIPRVEDIPIINLFPPVLLQKQYEEYEMANRKGVASEKTILEINTFLNHEVAKMSWLDRQAFRSRIPE